jgi:DNA replication protein DnaC
LPLAEQTTTNAAQGLAFEERLALLLEREEITRDNRRMTRLLQLATLKYRDAVIEDLDYRSRTGLDRSQLAGLTSCEWIRSTYLACALGHQACRQGLSVLYVRAPRLFEEFNLCHADGSFPTRLAAIAKISVLIIDDFAIAPIGARERNDLLELLDDRVGSRACIVTSQLPVNDWHDYIGDPTLADANLDRLTHRAHRIHLAAKESMREREATKLVATAKSATQP